MSISPKMIKDASEFVNVATNGYAEVSDSIADMSLNLTKLAGDMASFYNLDYEDVAEKMNSIFTGQTRPLRVFGLDLTQATLQEWALAHGMDVDVKKMTQAEFQVWADYALDLRQQALDGTLGFKEYQEELRK